jgi:hypothetical protein
VVALRSGCAIFAACALLLGSVAAPAPAPEAAQGARVEARSRDLLAVGTVHGDRMTIHLSRVIDNAPVHDAVVTVVLRGATHATTAEIDGSYSFQSPDLRLPGAASMQFQVALGAALEELTGALQIADAAERPEEKNSARQLGWWVLNFAVCIAFLVLWSRRKANRTG